MRERGGGKRQSFHFTYDCLLRRSRCETRQDKKAETVDSGQSDDSLRWSEKAARLCGTTRLKLEMAK